MRSPHDPNRNPNRDPNHKPAIKQQIGQQDVHPDIRCNAPGRIPESLIDAAIDGELNDDMQREIAQALSYDPVRKQELIDTSDAINALQMPISMPDFSDAVLARADRRRRFIPAAWRKHVRTGRLAIAAMLLLTLMSVATLQRVYPRLTTLASHPTPMLDIQQAMEHDTTQIAESVSEQVQSLRASLAPMADIFSAPGRTDHRFDRSRSALVESTIVSTSRSYFQGDYPSRTVFNSYKFPGTQASPPSFAGEIHFINLGHSIATVYIANNSIAAESSAFARTPHPSSMPRMGSWSSNTRASNIVFVRRQSSRSHTDHPVRVETVELDIPALP